MSEIKRFEDLIAWQRARALTRSIYGLTEGGTFARDYGLAGQIQRAAVSIMSNIAEGYDRGRTGEFFHFLSIAKGPCAELQSQLYVALDAGYLDQPAFDQLSAQAHEVGRIIGGLRASVQKRNAPPSTDS
ncbi:MAG TPA: four helix bundle protein [Thermomicrobiales bacterium]|nr:four helix bundle protein [Thermomicrobiales bacterium]